MTSQPPNLLQLAKQGNPQAISILMNRHLQAKGCTAKVIERDNTLQIVLESSQVPNQQDALLFVVKGLTNLGFGKVAKIYGQQIGEKLPAWGREIDFSQLQSETNQPSSEETIHCPQCQSVQVLASKQGFGLGKAVVGAILLGLIGLAGGFLGSNQVFLTCLKCGHRWKVEQVNSTIESKTKSTKYKQLIQAKGRLPTGILSKSFPIDFIVKFLEDNLKSDESFLDVIGVRFQGKNSFLILTSKRLICVHFKSDVIMGKNFEVSLILDYLNIDKFSIAPESGIIVKGKNSDFNMYFVTPEKQEKGKEFSESLKNLGIKVENLTIIPSDRHEKILLFQGIVGFIVIAALFSSCIHNAINRPEPTSSDRTEECLRKYIRGDTVEKHELEEAYRNCAP